MALDPSKITSALDGTNDKWAEAISFFTGFKAPPRAELFDTLVGNEGIPQMKVEISDVGYVDYVDTEDLNWLYENAGYDINNTDFVIPFYSTSGGAGSDVTMHKARITLLGQKSVDGPPTGGYVEGGTFTSSIDGHLGMDGKPTWDTTKLTQYSYGTGLALEQLRNDETLGTYGFSWNGAPVADGDSVSLGTFDVVAGSFDRVAQFFVKQQAIVEEWEGRLGTEKNEAWRGQAAGVFWDLLHKINKQYTDYKEDTSPNGNYYSKQGNEIRQAKKDLQKAVVDLHNVWMEWELKMGNPLRWLSDLLTDVMNYVWDNNITKITYEIEGAGYSYYTNYIAEPGFDNKAKALRGKELMEFGEGDLKDLSTWEAIGNKAIELWQQSVKDNLEAAAVDAMEYVKNAWSNSSFDLGTVKSRPGDTLKEGLAEDKADKLEDDNEKKEDDAKKAAEEAQKKQDEFIAWQKEQARIAKEEAAKEKAEAEAKAAAAEAKAEKEKEEAKAEREKEKAEAEAKAAAAEAKADAKAAEAEAKQEQKEKEQEEKAAEAEAKAAAKEAEQEAKAEAKEAEQEAKQEEKEKEQEAKQAEQQAKQEAKQEEAERKQEEAQGRQEQMQMLQMNQAKAQQEEAKKEQAKKEAEQEAKQAEQEAKQEAKQAEQEAKQEEKEKEAEQKQAEQEKKQEAKEAEQEAKQEEKEKEAEQKQAEQEAKAEARQNEAEAKQDQLQQEQEKKQNEAQAKQEQLQQEAEKKQNEAEARFGDQSRGLLNGGDLLSPDISGPVNEGNLPVSDVLDVPGGGESHIDDNGRLVTEYPDGSSTTIDPLTHSSTLTRPDGTTVSGPLNTGDLLPNPDGSTTRLDPQGNVVMEYPDGTSQTIDPDTGSTTITNPDGTTRSGYLNDLDNPLNGYQPPTSGPLNSGSLDGYNSPSYDLSGYEEELFDENPYESPLDSNAAASSGSSAPNHNRTQLNSGPLPGFGGGGADAMGSSSGGTGTGSGGMPMGGGMGGGMGGMGGGMGGAGGGQDSKAERVRSVIDGDVVSNRRPQPGARPPLPGSRGYADDEVRVAASGNTAGQNPFLPPMAGGGAPNQTQTQSGDRARDSWVPEDEDVWGTDEGGAPAVIGR